MQIALLQEPWCKSEAEVELLTDWQIVHRYLLPASERAREFEEQTARQRAELPGGGGAKPLGERKTAPAPRRKPGEKPQKGDPDYRGPEHEPGTPGHRREIIDAFVWFGMSPGAAAKEYERQLELWRAQEGK